MRSNWSASNYKVVTLLKTFPMIGHKHIYINKYEMVVIAKKFGTYVSLGSNHVHEKKEFKLPRGAT